MKRILPVLAAVVLAACGTKNAPRVATGYIDDATMNTLTITTVGSDPQQIVFSTADADKSEAYGMLIGNLATVDYTLDGEQAVATRVACDKTYADAVGRWTMPDPLDPEAVMGVELQVGGKAASIAMATLEYTSWELEGESGKLWLLGRSLGNGQTIDFKESATVSTDAEGKPILTLENGTVLHKQ